MKFSLPNVAGDLVWDDVEIVLTEGGPYDFIADERDKTVWRNPGSDQ